MPTLVSTGQITIVDQNDGLNLSLSKPAVVVPTATDGSGGTYGPGVTSTDVSVSNGADDDTLNWTYAFDASAGVTASMSGIRLTVTAMANDYGTVTITASRPGYASMVGQFSLAKAKVGKQGEVGTPGLNTANLMLYKRSDSAAANKLPSAAITYTFATGAYAGITNGWSAVFPQTGGAYLHVTTATASNTAATDTIAPGEWAADSLLVTDGASGVRGNVNIYVITTGTAWSDAAAVAGVAAAGYGAVIKLDAVTLYRSDKTFSEQRFWDGGSWTSVAAVISGNLLVQGSITGDKLVANTVTADKIDGRSLTIKDPLGNILLGVGVPLSTSLAAAGTLNSDIVVGGRNLYSRTQSYSDPTSSGSVVAERYPYSTADAFTLQGVTGHTGFQRMAIPNLAVGPYTLSFNLRMRDGPDTVAIDLADTATQPISANQTNAHYVLHFTVTNADLPWLDFAAMSANAYYFSQFKLETGTVATTYTPSPEDVAADTAAAQAAATAAGTAAANAQAAATSAQTTATDAQTAAATANAAIANISSDSVLSKGEKPAIIAQYSQIASEEAGNVAAAAALGLPTASYSAARLALANYLNGVPNGWNTTTTDSLIVAADFNAAFQNYYTARTTLLNAISAKLAANAATAQSAAAIAQSTAVSAGGVTLIGRNGVTVVGNVATKTGGTEGWNADAYSKDGYTGGVVVSAMIPLVGYAIFGFSTSPGTSSGYDTIAYGIEPTADGNIGRIINGASSGIIGTYVATDVLGVSYDGQNARWTKNGAVISTAAVATPITAPLYFDSSIYTLSMVLSNITFTGQTSNAWSAVGGTGKPADNATVGATFGLNVFGQMTAATVPTYIAANALTDTQIGGNLKSTNWAGPTTGPSAKGWLLERDTDTFYGYNAVLRGALMIGDYSGYAWPAAGGRGAYLGPGGLLLGNLSSNKYLQASADGDVYMPGFRVVNSQVYVDNPIITGGILDAFYSNNSGGGINGSYANGGATYGTLSMNVVGGRAPFNYYWFINPGNASGTVKVRVSFQGGAPNAPVATILGSGTNDDLDGTVMCICIDANGRAVTAAFAFYVRHGVPP